MTNFSERRLKERPMLNADDLKNIQDIMKPQFEFISEKFDNILSQITEAVKEIRLLDIGLKTEINDRRNCYFAHGDEISRLHKKIDSEIKPIKTKIENLENAPGKVVNKAVEISKSVVSLAAALSLICGGLYGAYVLFISILKKGM
jgi:hypothetical protein